MRPARNLFILLASGLLAAAMGLSARANAASTNVESPLLVV